MTNEQPDPNEHSRLRSLRLGRDVQRIATAVRTDVGADGEAHMYRSGTHLYKGHYDAVNAAWKYVELT